MKEQFGLYLIATNPVAGYEAIARAAVNCNVRYLQLRMKTTPRETVLEMAYRFRAITLDTETRLIVNDDLEIAMEVDADGIHLGQGDLSIEEARRRWPAPGKQFGLSTHSLEQAREAELQAPDYIGIGPAYPTLTKTDADPAIGPSETGRIAQATSLTSVAIGGINPDNLPQLLQAGATNFCVISAVNASADPAGAIQALQAIWKKHRF
ncbi:MAG: thiamine phosphate synthase [Pontiellaceae bacterium]|nr:thiamine phosphate synthase [Pontiellaceae bacterium]MBN2786208.1 thiamine phosphate synthase [Pontiellaceae bacterium]